MAHILAVGDIVRVKFSCLLVDQYSQNTRFWEVSSITGASVNDQAMADALSTSAAAIYKPLMSPQASYYGLQLAVIKPVAYIPVTSTQGQGAGTQTGDALPPLVSGLVRFYTPFAGRSFQGRTYAPFPPESRNDLNGNPDSTYLTALANLGLYMSSVQTATSGGNTANMVALLYTKGGAHQTFITTFQTSSKWAQQRHRSRQKHGDAAPF